VTVRPSRSFVTVTFSICIKSPWPSNSKILSLDSSVVVTFSDDTDSGSSNWKDTVASGMMISGSDSADVALESTGSMALTGSGSDAVEMKTSLSLSVAVFPSVLIPSTERTSTFLPSCN